MIPGLDGLRAIAIVLVIALHNEILPAGWIGVQLFFVLSGFLITRILLQMKDQMSTGREYFRIFYGRRFLRIFPVYYFYLLLMGVICYILYSAHYRPNKMLLFFEQLPFALTYTFNFFSATIYFTNTFFLTHFWSLSLEEQFYLVWPALIFLLPKQHRRIVFLAVICMGPLFRILYSLLIGSLHIDSLNANIPLALYSLPFSHLDAFGLGAFICCFQIPRPKQQLLFLAILLPLVGIFTEFAATHNWQDSLSSFGYPFTLANGWKYIWGYALLDYFFAIVIYCVAYENLFVNFLEVGVVKYLGKISYGLYVYHYVMIWFAQRVFEYFNYPGAVKIPVLIASSLTTLLVAGLSYKWLEAPILGLKDRFFKVPQNVAGGSAGYERQN